MKLVIEPFSKTDKSTISKMYIDGGFECYTLEDKVREIIGKPVSEWKVQDKTAIPAGTYKVILNMSPRLKKIMPRLLDVPGFDGILIHSGNKSEDTKGCILVGAVVDNGDFIHGGSVEFPRLFAKLKAALDRKEAITIEVKR